MNFPDPRQRTIDVAHDPPPASRPEISRLAELIRGIRTAMLVTRTPRGHVRARPMTTMQSDLDDELWFFIDRRSSVVDELTEDHQVGITFVDPPRYVAVSGVGHVVDDAELCRRFWHPGAAEWFPDGPEQDPHLVLLRVQLEEAEYWDRNRKAMVKLFGFDAWDERVVPPRPETSATEPPEITS